MTHRDAYKQKLEAEIDLIVAKIQEFKAKAKVAVADARIQATSTIQGLEQRLDAAKARLSELNSASDDAWESVKSGVEKAWDELRDAFTEAKERFQK